MHAVEQRHALYDLRRPQWKRQRDVIEGEDAVKGEGSTYLPVLDAQKLASVSGSGGAHVQQLPVTSYEAYKARASFINATARTLDGLIGQIMRKEPTIVWKGDKKVLKRVGRGGETLDEITNETINEVVGIGRYGQLIDAFSGSNARSYIATYYAEDIIDWEDAVVKDIKQPVLIKLQEEITLLNPTDGTRQAGRRFRLLKLGRPAISDENSFAGIDLSDVNDVTNPIYWQEIWEDTLDEGGQRSLVRKGLVIPRRAGGGTWDEIPFTFFNPDGTSSKPCKPPLMDMALVNLAHYRNSADLEHGLHFTGLPQPWAAGFDFKGELYIGSGMAWVTNEPGAKCGYLEFSGQGLAAIAAAMEDKKKTMAAIGARLLEDSRNTAEAAQTVRLRTSGEKSALTKIVHSISMGLTRSLQLLNKWQGGNGEVEIGLNDDFGVEGLTSDEILALVQAWQAGGISWKTMFWNFKRGELIPNGVDEETEFSQIEEGSPKKPLTDEEKQLLEAQTRPPTQGGSAKKPPAPKIGKPKA